jgi:hypothetical protein
MQITLANNLKNNPNTEGICWEYVDDDKLFHSLSSVLWPLLEPY